MIPSQKDPLDEIKDIYQNISEWLKFAEAKHAGLIAVWIALFVAIFSERDMFINYTCLYTLILLLLLFGFLINLISFMPFLNRSTIIKHLCSHSCKAYSGNRIFYQSIFVDTYISNVNSGTASLNIYKQNFLPEFSAQYESDLLNDYIRQIIDVSTVGTIKTYLFGLSIKYTIVVIIIITAGLIIA